LPAFVPQRTNLTLVGVPVPPGSYRFELVYQPLSVRWGLGISGGALLILAALGLWRALKRKARA
jgi:hypothetical protein